MSEKRTVVITGANRGIGLELARYYAGEGCDVIGVCREASAELTEVAARVIEGIDVTKDAGVDKLTDALAGERIDLLINNAGLLQDEKLGSIDFDSIRIQMEINAYAPLRVTEALVSQIPSGGKIANITSRMGSIADNDSGGRYGYRASKAALNAFGKSLAMDLKPRGIAVASCTPLCPDPDGKFWRSDYARGVGQGAGGAYRRPEPGEYGIVLAQQRRSTAVVKCRGTFPLPIRH